MWQTYALEHMQRHLYILVYKYVFQA